MNGYVSKNGFMIQCTNEYVNKTWLLFKAHLNSTAFYFVTDQELNMLTSV